MPRIFQFLQPPREQPRLLFRFVQLRQIVGAGFVVEIRLDAPAFFETQKQFRARRRDPRPAPSAARVSGEPNFNCASAS